MKLSLMAAVARNGIIGNGPDIPWHAKGEQLLFKALTYGQWLLVGRKTFESMGVLPNRKYVVVSRAGFDYTAAEGETVLHAPDIDSALSTLATQTDHAFVAGGGEIYRRLIDRVNTLHISTIDIEPTGDVRFPDIPDSFSPVFSQAFTSNINYHYQIWQRQENAQ